ncbi:50S ribosomal protein L18 [Candidatus Margulisiibacteriota bacterium]
MKMKRMGTEARPRMCVHKSTYHTYVQVVNDVAQHTIVASSSLALKLKAGGTIDAAKAVGKDIAEKCKKKNITKVFFDRRDKLFHGVIAALADSAREHGLEF